MSYDPHKSLDEQEFWPKLVRGAMYLTIIVVALVVILLLLG